MARASKPFELKGAWHITRRIIGANSHFEGTATLTPDGDTLAYREDGILQHNGTASPAFRQYIYRQTASRLVITHPDGAAFLDLNFENGEARARHICGADTYDALFRFYADGHWMTAYDISGPHKNYRIVTRLKRQVA